MSNDKHCEVYLNITETSIFASSATNVNYKTNHQETVMKSVLFKYILTRLERNRKIIRIIPGNSIYFFRHFCCCNGFLSMSLKFSLTRLSLRTLKEQKVIAEKLYRPWCT